MWEMKRNLSVVRFKFHCNILISGKLIKEMPGSVASETHCIYSVLCLGTSPATDRSTVQGPYQQPQTRFQAPKSGGLGSNWTGRAMAWNNFKIFFFFSTLWSTSIVVVLPLAITRTF